MDVTPLVKAGSQIIQSYAGGRFRVSGQIYEGGVIVLADRTIDWTVTAGGARMLGEKAFDPLVELGDSVDVILLGTGDRLEFLLPAMKNALKARGLRIEVMDTGAACRTYNVLMAEGRRVAAALMPVAVQPEN